MIHIIRKIREVDYVIAGRKQFISFDQRLFKLSLLFQLL